VTGRAKLARIPRAICDATKATTLDQRPAQRHLSAAQVSDLITAPRCSECNSGSSIQDGEFKPG
jgi:hypothetical protein